jgi:hypothetical protein
VSIPRFQLFELEDLSWFPRVLRDLATDYLHFIERTLQLERPVVPILADAVRASSAHRLVDLCSGAGGPVPSLQSALAAQGLDLQVTLTDRFPNLVAFRELEAASKGRITFVSYPVDARAVPSDLIGFRTIFNSFHHFGPTDARAVLRNALEARQPIGVFEIPERRALLLPLFLLSPLLVLVATPFIRPFRWRRLFWTYLLPLVPLTCLWDGIVSVLRAYTVAELEGLAHSISGDGYAWQAGRVPVAATPAHVTYLWGYPR